MENFNKTVAEFILLGFSIGYEEGIFLAMVFLAMYVTTLAGNMVIFCIVLVDDQLHTPMYFFLGNFSILDILFTSVVSPPLLWNLLSGDKSISFSACMAQSYFYFFLGTVEFFLLTFMSYDRYAAICKPLHYHTIMNDQVCIKILLGSWFFGFLSVLCPTIKISRLTYCKSNIINHFFCDSGPLLELSCSDTSFIELMDFMLSSLVILGSTIMTAISYACILSTILHIPTNTGRMKAFNTCASHLTLISLSCGISIFTYVTPSQKETLDAHKVPAVLSTIVCPFINPFLFTLKNNNFQEALRKVFHQIWNSTVQKLRVLGKGNALVLGKD
ncbi:olfactory receptor 6J1-like [Elgaria multicarinata webbii]|uniref:olfactory receptor 6J1-like n=1 Tax=Elgaria multicarinata webbii TaxID=159646 RepID=UPI002FCD5C04